MTRKRRVVEEQEVDYNELGYVFRDSQPCKGALPPKEANQPESGPTFARFMEEVRATMEGKAVEKGYSDRGVDGPNQLLDFTEDNFPGHSLGEVIYKAVRYQRKGDPEDLVKIAAWTFLRWRRHQEQG